MIKLWIYLGGEIIMRKLRIASILSLIMNMITMFLGIGVVTYYVDNLRVRALSVALLIATGYFASNTVRQVFKNTKKI